MAGEKKPERKSLYNTFAAEKRVFSVWRQIAVHQQQQQQRRSRSQKHHRMSQENEI